MTVKSYTTRTMSKITYISMHRAIRSRNRAAMNYRHVVANEQFGEKTNQLFKSLAEQTQKDVDMYRRLWPEMYIEVLKTVSSRNLGLRERVNKLSL